MKSNLVNYNHNKHMKAIQIPKCRGQMSLAVDTTLDFTTPNTYQKVIGTWSDGYVNKFIVSDVNDRITYTGTQSMAFLFTGVMDSSVNKACETMVGLYKNDSLVVGAETVHTFTSAAKVGTIAITRITQINPGDYFEVWIKSTDDTAKITFNSLNITFFGEN